MPNRFVKRMGKNESVLGGLKGFSNVKKKEGKEKVWHLWPMNSGGCGLIGLFDFIGALVLVLRWKSIPGGRQTLRQECCSDPDEKIIHELQIWLVLRKP